MTAEQLYVSQTNFFALQPSGLIPEPPIFEVNGLKYTVPPYYSFNHSETVWLVNMIKSNNWARIYRVITCNQCYLMKTYCQFPDSPEPSRGQPMFHRKAVLYLTPLALAIYLRQHKIAIRMMEYENERKEKAADVNQPCFVTNYVERHSNINDIMLIYPFCIMFRRECFECAKPLLLNGWFPQDKISLPYRRISQVFVFHYKDIVEYCLAQMVTRPNLRLPRLFDKLIGAFHDNFTLLQFENVIIKDNKSNEIKDLVSIPRRLLRYIYYYDRDLRLVSQVISSIRVMVDYGFFVGPRRDPLAISYKPSGTGNDEQNMTNDQDNSIALILGICDIAEMKGHVQTRLKLLDLLAQIIVDTKWYIKFFTEDSQILSDYFSNLIEQVKPLKTMTLEVLRVRLLNLLEVSEIDSTTIKELYDPNHPKRHWKENLDIFLGKRTDKSDKNNNTSRMEFRDINDRMSANIFTNMSVVNLFEGPTSNIYFDSLKY